MSNDLEKGFDINLKQSLTKPRSNTLSPDLNMPDQDETSLHIRVGDTLQLQFLNEDPQRRHYVHVIGYFENHSLLVRTPVVDGKVMLVREGSIVNVRMMTGMYVYGFSSRILRTCSIPYPYLHLEYPRNLEQTVVRSAQRVQTNIVVSIRVNNIEGFTGNIVDASTQGALLKCSDPIAKVGDHLTLTTRLTVGGISKYIGLKALVRNIHESSEENGDSSGYLFGIQFQSMEDDDHILLQAFVYEQILTGP